jgi:hypothetical protein
MKIHNFVRCMCLKAEINLCNRYFRTLPGNLYFNVNLLLAVFVVVNVMYIRIRGKGYGSNVTLGNAGEGYYKY